MFVGFSASFFVLNSLDYILVTYGLIAGKHVPRKIIYIVFKLFITCSITIVKKVIFQVVALLIIRQEVIHACTKPHQSLLYVSCALLRCRF